MVVTIVRVMHLILTVIYFLQIYLSSYVPISVSLFSEKYSVTVLTG